VETTIWLPEVAQQSTRGRLLNHLAAANKDANPELMRLALKLATGAGKTTVMFMLIARGRPSMPIDSQAAKHFTHGFLVCAPGLTVEDRLRVLQSNDPDRYYANREIVPSES
jgi:type III restriction enzyme